MSAPAAEFPFSQRGYTAGKYREFRQPGDKQFTVPVSDVGLSIDRM